MDNNYLIKKITQLGKEKYKTLKNIWDITEKQASNCTEEQLLHFINLLDERQQYIERINEIDKIFEETSKILKERMKIKYLDEINVKEYPMVKDYLKISKDIINLVKRIKSLDDENNTRIEKLFSDTKIELKKIGQGKTANKLYQHDNIGLGGTFFDTKK